MDKHPAQDVNYETNMDNKNVNSEDCWRVFTDGSRRAEGVGCGIVIFDPKNIKTYQASLKMANYCTITQAELWGIFKALQHIDKKSQWYKGPTIIYTDSRVVIHTLKNQTRSTLLAHETIELAHRIGGNKILKFHWIPGHKGYEENETADMLAKKAAKSNLPITYSRIPIKVVKQKIKEIIDQRWQEEWEHSNTGRTLYSFIPTIAVRRACRHLKPTYEITQCLLGHGNFNEYLFRFGKRNTDKCDIDSDSIDNVTHYLFQCSKYEHPRETFMRQCVLAGSNWPPKRTALVQSKMLFDNLCKFIKATKKLSARKQSEYPPEDNERTLQVKKLIKLSTNN
ncbi:uncharacterized protein [Centruroides vittatus]|uniref:uncharacterized protein n=1 Tax=Centruroides vittatus TaxID=120091 RepID=UPI0035101EEA